ncbi:MAG: SPOR domain-containing protein, partial [Rhodobacteraceae bacterium]|nr:SPOR domain-containing protein [Paracoccaceae bacterium]
PLSQQYKNTNARYPVRCGPQTESSAPDSAAPEYRRSVSGQSLAAEPTPRIVPRHVYEKRQNTTNAQIAVANQNVGADSRLTPSQAKPTTAPAVVRQVVLAPIPGYKTVWEDDRLNPARATGTAAGEAQTNRIWTQTVPRKLIVPPLPDSKQVLVLSSRDSEPVVSRSSSRSAPQAKPSQIADKSKDVRPKYVRVATYDTDAGARTTAQRLAQTGLPMRLGTVTRKGKAYRVVLAGPFASADQANTALSKVRDAGFSKARISKY